jgi:hypothetical protein
MEDEIMSKGNPQIDNLVKQHQDLLLQREIRAEEKRRKEGKSRWSPFEGSCTSMNRNQTHSKTYRKTARALLRV